MREHLQLELCLILLITLARRDAVDAVSWIFSHPPVDHPLSRIEATNEVLRATFKLNLDNEMADQFTITFDIKDTLANLTDLFLEKHSPGRATLEACLTNRVPGLESATTIQRANGFEGDVISKTISYSWATSFPSGKANCKDDSTVFISKVATSSLSNRIAYKIKIFFEALSTAVEINPLGDDEAKHESSEIINVDCKATLGSVNRIPNKEVSDGALWKWEIQKISAGETEFGEWKDITKDDESSEEFNTIVNTVGAMLGPCKTLLVQTNLERILRTFEDHQSRLRCSYLHPENLNQSVYDLTQSAIYATGNVVPATKNPLVIEYEIIYADSSLYLLVLGSSSLVLVSFMAICYLYRKTRTGKKYDIVKQLLDQEEEELKKIEERLGTTSTKSGKTQESASSVAPEESSAAESSVAEA